MRKVVLVLITTLLLVGCTENKTALQKLQADVVEVAGVKRNIVDSVDILVTNPREFSSSKETEKSYMMMLHITNKSDKPIAVSASDFLLQTDVYNFYSHTESTLPITSLDAAELLPKASVTGMITYTIPANEKPMCLVYEGLELTFSYEPNVTQNYNSPN